MPCLMNLALISQSVSQSAGRYATSQLWLLSASQKYFEIVMRIVSESWAFSGGYFLLAKNRTHTDARRYHSQCIRFHMTRQKKNETQEKTNKQ